MSNPELEDLLRCMICFESYSNPKMLQCTHTFCAECLRGYLQTYQQQKRSHSGKLPCPTCRELTPLPNNGVSGLRNDFKVKKIEEMFRTVNLRDRRSSSKMCDSCRADARSITARYYCPSCNMSYCEPCLKKHKKNPIFKGHRVVDKQIEKSDSVLCSVHKTEQVKFFCRECQTAICTICVMNTHESHDVTELTSIYKSQQDDIREMQTTVEEKMGQLRQKGSELEKLRQLNLKSAQLGENAIKERSMEIIEMVKQQEDELLNELRKKRDEKLNLISKELETVNFYVAKSFSLQEFATMTVQRNSLRLMALHDELTQRMKTVIELDVSYMIT